uniref:Serpentine receptor class gamma n=1 Tax=Caenorhabditis japonica TaxID=281687 RepID=A0A8R1E0M1_CAEJA
MWRTSSENKSIEQSLTASALCMSIFYVVVLSMEIYFYENRPETMEMAEFWKALVEFAFDILVICPPVIMLCLNIRLRVDVFYQKNYDTTTNSNSVK